MIDVTYRQFLEGQLKKVPVYFEIPPKRPKRFVLLERTAEGKRDRISQSTFAVQCYGPSLVEAARLCESVKEATERFVERDEVGAVRFQTSYNFTKPDTKEYRFQAVFDFYY